MQEFLESLRDEFNAGIINLDEMIQIINSSDYGLNIKKEKTKNPILKDSDFNQGMGNCIPSIW